MRWIDMPPVWLAGLLLLSWLFRGVGPDFALESVGALIVLAGACVIALAAREFRRHRTSIIPGDTPSALVTTRIYRFSRNPIYLADVAILLGASLYWGSLPGLILAPILAMILQLRFILPEEQRIQATFLSEFDAYAQQTNRWL
ncbi:isoprenylcysteine carboxylmethyltransferase family protein [Roseivivax sp. THAF30]|uniref:methyltransferase family protein n=1 Tax=Roseivivax sp. THAF30 TaxID=2587852 RepID=UPI0012A791D5|nr:isoprenylcysteine carboxylmethyltransferase family protein [Roseivivax sp. THAF30]QFT63759.1 hypothetical protein FIU91_12540 [Roseivivax sp. THAF30]